MPFTCSHIWKVLGFISHPKTSLSTDFAIFVIWTRIDHVSLERQVWSIKFHKISHPQLVYFCNTTFSFILAARVGVGAGNGWVWVGWWEVLNTATVSHLVEPPARSMLHRSLGSLRLVASSRNDLLSLQKQENISMYECNYIPRMRVGNVFLVSACMSVCVCLSVCLAYNFNLET